MVQGKSLGGEKMIEYEKKIPLTAKEFKILTQIEHKCDKVCQQTNFYYDTDDFEMNEKKITCRIREKNGEYTATIKEHSYGREPNSIETSRKIKNRFDDSLFVEKGLSFKGSLTTERIYIVNDCDLKVSIDKNSYLDCTDYEIEIEYSPNEYIFAQKHITYYEYLFCVVYKTTNLRELQKRIKSAQSKSERFFKRLKRTLS